MKRFESTWYGMTLDRLEARADEFAHSLDPAVWEDDGIISMRREVLDEFKHWVPILKDVGAVPPQARPRVRDILRSCAVKLSKFDEYFPELTEAQSVIDQVVRVYSRSV